MLQECGETLGARGVEIFPRPTDQVGKEAGEKTANDRGADRAGHRTQDRGERIARRVFSRAVRDGGPHSESEEKRFEQDLQRS